LGDAELQKLKHRVRERLAAEWERVRATANLSTALPDEIKQAVAASVNSRTKTYRYVLPTQLVSKLVDPNLDARCLQEGAPFPGAFDARTIAHDVIVPFDRANENVLGGSTEPYTSNPLRSPAIVPIERAQRKDKTGFDHLMLVLDYAQANPTACEALLIETLLTIKARLDEVRIVYPVPNRTSHSQVQRLLEEYLADRSGGVRMQAVAVALFQTVGSRFGLFARVISSNVNAADASTGATADLECVNDDGTIVMAIEVKDRQLELRQVQGKLPNIREKGVRELMFLVNGGVVEGDADSIHQTVDRQFITGQNIYVVEWAELLNSCLVLFGEEGRRAFLQRVGSELDERRIDLRHRNRWAEILRAV
jgi:hypothetical protein